MSRIWANLTVAMLDARSPRHNDDLSDDQGVFGQGQNRLAFDHFRDRSTGEAPQLVQRLCWTGSSPRVGEGRRYDNQRAFPPLDQPPDYRSLRLRCPVIGARRLAMFWTRARRSRELPTIAVAIWHRIRPGPRCASAQHMARLAPCANGTGCRPAHPADVRIRWTPSCSHSIASVDVCYSHGTHTRRQNGGDTMLHDPFSVGLRTGATVQGRHGPPSCLEHSGLGPGSRTRA